MDPIEYKVIFEDSPVGIVGQKNGELIIANESYSNLLGYNTPEAVIGLQVRDVFAGDEADKIHQRALNREKGKNEPQIYYSELEHKDGHPIPVKIQISKMKIGEDFVNIAFIEDQTPKERLIQKLQESNRDLEEFAFIASHDLQEPLRMISSYLELISNKYEGEIDDKMDRYISYAVDGAYHLKELIQGLLHYSRINSRGDEFEYIDMTEIIEVLLRTLKLKIEETDTSITIKNTPPVYGDPTQIAQLFQNIIENAIKFRQKDLDPIIKIDGRIIGSYVYYTIKDNGIGIEPQYQDQIFKIFKQLHSKAEYQGTGIGLALCSKIVERHNGSITVESGKDEGSKFMIKLPKGDRK